MTRPDRVNDRAASLERRKVPMLSFGRAGLAQSALAALAVFAYAPDKPRAELEAVYPGDYRMVDGVRLRLRDTGPRDASAVVLVHGFCASLDTWESWAAALSARHRVIRFDLPGFGLTGPDPSGDYSDAREAEILRDLLDQLGIANASLVGHSMGARIAWTFAALYPGRVARLVLISPVGREARDSADGVAAPILLRAIPFVAPRMLLRAGLGAAYGREDAVNDTTVERYRDLLLAPGVRQAIVARARRPTSRPPDLARIRAPTLLLWGERDRIVPVATAAEFMRDLPRASLVRLPNLGHVPFEEDPDGSLSPLEDFLSEPAPAAAVAEGVRIAGQRPQ